jgi:uncharacterized membrane protein YeiH
MASTRRPAVHHTAGITRLVAPVVRHLVLAVVVDAIALAAHSQLGVRIALAVICLAGHPLWHRRWR